MSQIVTTFWGLAKASHSLSGGVNKRHGGIIVILIVTSIAASIVASIVASKKLLIEKFSWVHYILRIEYFLYRFHIRDLCCTT
jgi:hypothetical protein